MQGVVRSVAVLVCVLALTSAQNIFFSTGGSGSTGSCEYEGRSGSCKEVFQCPELLSYVRSRNFAALKAAQSNCGTKLIQGKPKPVRLLCCPESAETTTPPAAVFRNHPQCGVSDFMPGRIVGGEPVRSLHDYPWMAILKWEPDGNKPEYRCGGAVLNERWVLTAAHCLADNGPVAVRVRDLDLATSNDDSYTEPPIDVPVERLFPHPEYVQNRTSPYRGLFSDIALIKLSSDLEFSDISKPLCLPRSRRSTKEYERLKTSYIAGWGLTEFAGDASSRMMWATVNVTNHRACQESYRRTGGRVDDSEHICASGNDLKQAGCVPGANDGSCRGGVDACEGDSGGPLMERRDEKNRQRWYTIGVVSYGTGCGNPFYPGIYTRVDHFLDWIAETVAGN